MDFAVLDLIAGHLTVADLFRIHRAMRLEEAELYGLLVNHHRSVVGGSTRVRDVSRRMRSSSRCRECGRPSRRAVGVCKPCGRQPNSLVTLWTRRDVANLTPNPRWILRTVAPAARVGNGAYVYWRRDVLRASERLEGGDAVAP